MITELLAGHADLLSQSSRKIEIKNAWENWWTLKAMSMEADLHANYFRGLRLMNEAFKPQVQNSSVKFNGAP
jgi:hypothetical protein